jgi:hypothetical protein
MYEEKFTGSEQTVVIWCLQDFLRNSKYCSETLQMEERKIRQRQSLERREQLRWQQLK